MPALLRSRLAVAVLFGVFLIPIFLMSSLRGVTHVVSCAQPVERPFQVEITGDEPIITGSALVVAGEDTGCGPLTAEIIIRSEGTNRLAVTVPITNGGESAWRGTVQLEVGSTLIPITIGLVPGGGTREQTVILKLPDGVSSFQGSLLIGP